MPEERIFMYCGTGYGRSAAAIGQSIRYACEGRSVFVVQFLKGKARAELDYLKKLEPEIKLFSFDKFDACYSNLNEEEKAEERLHIINALNYAKKVLVTSECDVLVLDEVLDLAELGIIPEEDLISLIQEVAENDILIMTGTERCEKLWPYADRVTLVQSLKETVPLV